MIDLTSIPSSTAQQLNDMNSFIIDNNFTYTITLDETTLYNTISKRLIALETSLEINKDELEAINRLTEEFRIAIEEKNEVQLRIDWLRRLYEVSDQLELVKSKEEAISLKRLLSPVQTSPMKKFLIDELDKLKDSLPLVNPIKESAFQKMMEKAINELGTPFINLGKVGREYVISNMLEKFGDNVNINEIREFTNALEQSVSSLSKVNNLTEMVHFLEQLPLQTFIEMKKDRKEMIAEHLIEKSDWNGFADLERMIAQINNSFTQKENKHEEVNTNNGFAAFSINIENEIEDIIKIG